MSDPSQKSDGLADGGLYPMRLVTRLTGLSADTIRAWQRRYGAVEPLRSAGNTRRFSAEDVRRLILLRDATAQGHAISSVAQLSLVQLEQLLGRGAPPPPPAPSASSSGTLGTGGGAAMDELRSAYLEALERFASREAYEVLMRAATFLERRAFVTEVIVPIVREVGVRWQQGQLGVAQESMVASQLRSVLASMLRLTPPPAGAPQILLCTPAGHRYELAILVGALLAASRGLDPLYLGAELPAEELRHALQMSRAPVVVLSIARDVDADEAQVLPFLVRQLAAHAEVWVGLPRNHPLGRGLAPARVFHELETFDAALERF